MSVQRAARIGKAMTTMAAVAFVALMLWHPLVAFAFGAASVTGLAMLAWRLYSAPGATT